MSQSRVQSRRSLLGEPVALARSLQRRGAPLVRVGQQLALTPERIADEFLPSLLLLEDRAAPMPFAEFRRLLEEETERGQIDGQAHGLLQALDPQPIRSTWLDQTHRARLPSGEVVAVKIRRRGASNLIREGLHPRRVARELQVVGPIFLGSPLQTLEEIRAQLVSALDFGCELEQLQQLWDERGGEENERIPRPVAELCSDRVLTCEYLEGTPLIRLLLPRSEDADQDPSAESLPDDDLVAGKVIHATLEQLFRNLTVEDES